MFDIDLARISSVCFRADIDTFLSLAIQKT
jgi:hypothetical protein